MSIADKLIQITENLKKIYDKGYQDGYAAGSGSMGEDTYNYTCPNCGEIFYTEGPPYCPSCGANHDEWYEGMPSYTCSNCG